MPLDIRIRFGRALRRKRTKLGVSQEAFADMCELDRSYIGGIERGERNVALVNIEKIAKTLRLTVAELFRGV
ncbi:MAG: helix-turn-helix domain-containing protein [Candidatus Acidiferrales bacterium]